MPVKLIQGSNISPHEAQAASARPAAFLSKYLRNPVGLKDLLHSRFSQPGHLATFLRAQRLGFEWQSPFLRGLRDNQGDTQAALFCQLWVFLTKGF